MAKRRFESVRSALSAGGREHECWSLRKLAAERGASIERLPFSIRILLENVLRHEDGRVVKPEDVEAVLRWDPTAKAEGEISFHPARVLLQDFTGVPCVVDLAAMREAIAALGGDPQRINPLEPVDLVIDHSIQVDRFASIGAFPLNQKLEYRRNRERYELLRWAQGAFRDFRAFPPGAGICHQVNLEHLGRVVMTKDGAAYPDTLVGTDSHTTMINGLGVLGWGVGGIEAEAAMLGQPCTMLIPQVVGFKLSGELTPGTTATDLVLTVTEMLRKKGVVGKFVEFYGPGLSALSLPDRATISNMSPEYGATAGYFPVDEETLAYLRLTGRPEDHVALVEAYCREQGLFRTGDTPDPEYSSALELDLAGVEPSIAGPKRPQDRVPLKDAKRIFRASLHEMLGGEKTFTRNETIGRWLGEGGSPVWSKAIAEEDAAAVLDRHAAGTAVAEGEDALGRLASKATIVQNRGLTSYELRQGAVVIAAITSCTNTSNPSVMLGAALLAKKAIERGVDVKPWVKTSLAPGSKVVMDYLRESRLLPYLEALGFHLVGFGCTTCIGNSGPLPKHILDAVTREDLVVASALSGNRNFEGRINGACRMNFLMSPPLVVAYAIAGTMDIDMNAEPLGYDRNGEPVFLRDVWPTPEEVREAMRAAIRPEHYARNYERILDGDEEWRGLEVPEGDRFRWADESTYVRRPPYFEGMGPEPPPLEDVKGARVLALLGESVTTDHISPAGEIPEDTPAGRYLIERGVAPGDFNSYGSRRGNHEVMVRGTFANIRLKNRLVPGVEGGFTAHQPSGERMTIFEAAERYRREGVPLVVIAGAEYGTGSSRDWAAKGPALLGVRAAVAKSFERIHRSNLIGMGVLPLEFEPGQDAKTLGLTGRETIDVGGIADGLATRKRLAARAVAEDGSEKTFTVVARLDTPNELDYFRHGGILQYVLRQLAGARPAG